MGNDVKHLQNSAQANNLYALNLMKISTSEGGYSQEQRLEMQKRAVSHFKRAVEIYPKFKNAWFDLGRSAFIINDLKNAILGFGKSIELNPDYSEAYFMLCDIYVTQNNKKLFLKTAKSLYKIDKSQKAYVILTDAFFMNGLKDDANQVLKKALKKFPKDNNLLLLYDKINL
jgi:tetratricopeptide (TPR) repeat protein